MEGFQASRKGAYGCCNNEIYATINVADMKLDHVIEVETQGEKQVLGGNRRGSCADDQPVPPFIQNDPLSFHEQIQTTGGTNGVTALVSRG
jgi:hypothetical protein